MASPRPEKALLALCGIALGAAVGAGSPAAWAQQVSMAKLVPAPALAQTNPTNPTAPAIPVAVAGGSSSTAQPANLVRAAGKQAQALIGVGGRVLASSSPLGAAGVYAYQLATLTLHKVETDPQGNFLFSNLPAGLYKIIANKPGFVPAVTLVTRSTAQAYQFLELQMAPQGPQRAGATLAPTAPVISSDFWALRASIPPDVLRDIDAAAPAAEEAGAKAARAGLPGEGAEMPAANSISTGSLAGRFRTEVQAMTGVADVAQVGVGQVSTGKLGIQGQLGAMAVGLSGNFWQMTSDSPLPGAPGGRGTSGSSDGQTSAVTLNLQPGAGSRITLDSVTDRLLPRAATGALEPVGLDHYQVSWSQALGQSSRSDLSAQYTNETNYHRSGPIDPADVPDASRTWRVDGSYTTGLGDASSLQAGFRYSEMGLGLAPLANNPQSPTANSLVAITGTVGPSPQVAPAPMLPPALSNVALSALGSSLAQEHQTVDFFSRGSTHVEPALMVEYGLYSTLQDGSLALTPEGGVVLQLGAGWQASGNASHRVYQEQSYDPQFLPTLYKDSDLCEMGSRACYELSLANHSGDNTVTLSAVERIVGQTLRLYFSDVVFDRDESLYLVSGDRLPEVRLQMNRRVGGNVRTSLTSSVASGGGGIFVGSDGHLYQNQVRYMVTSLDTHFLSSATGVFLAFHHLTQNLGPVGGAAPASGAGTPTAIAFDRLQLMLSQDLNFLWNLAAEWALQVNMELTRGTDPTDPFVVADSQLHRRILGGIAVKF